MEAGGRAARVETPHRPPDQPSLGNICQFWQHDYFDRLIRDGDHLRDHEFTLWESDLAKAV
jgi:hypothetical protein